MPAGMEFYYPDGRVKIAYTDYFAAVRSSFTTTAGATSGTFTDTSLIGKALVHFVSSTTGNYGGPMVTLDSNTGVISWSFNVTTSGGASAGASPATTIYYGGY
ncbi:MAG: hypothetical protein DI555_07855 [Novosphingobium pentaromativorans]|uniref:Peptidase S1 domain-containing protein n=1 Tax=Novosphingobium pentaromativorans TaxID=205844 RepID=A0A2W5QCL5_9SPHN|nr:MAG: hypothetical protein DI555_07855 [Novosphingobium pentaromativorans]